MRIIRDILLAAVAFFLLKADSCDNHLIEDNGFELWCGEQLCSWELESGSLRQVPTWHKDDIGVELVGDDVAISQASEQSPGCIQFNLVTDISADATVTLEIDYSVDGRIDEEINIPAARWAPVEYKIQAPPAYVGVLFRLRKRGTGRARLAQIEAISVGCADADGVTRSQPLGYWCTEGSECESGICAQSIVGSVCSKCASDAQCGGDLCGYVEDLPGNVNVYRVCVEAASREFGARCGVGEECETGVCEAGFCSTCDESADCGGGACVPYDDWDEPRVCDPEGGQVASGEFCVRDADCASGTCTGGELLGFCDADGRTCDDDLDCPPPLFSDQLGRCVTLGEKNGICS